ncbi:MAG TPA: sugar kinase [Angustibacter sp.]|nr:sugar kinase [Angustibacter sp.]
MSDPGGSARVDVLTFGEAMVAFRCAGPLAQGSALTARLAGAEANVAIGLARLGHRVRWVGRLGADPLGDLVQTQLRAEGVDVAHVLRDAQRPTGLMVVEARTADLARVEYRRSGSAASVLSPGDLSAALDAGARCLHLTGITPALSGTARQTTLGAARAAREAGVLVCLDVNYRSRLWSRDAASVALRELAAHADVVVASDDELPLLTDPGSDEHDEDAAIAALLDAGARLVAVKRGAAGATLVTADQRHDAAALAVTAVDTLGAGDAFTAGLLSGLLDDLEPAEALRRAVTLGAFAVSTAGDWEGLPTRAELPLLDGLQPGSAVR